MLHIPDFKMRNLLRLNLILTLSVVLCSCSLFTKQTKQETSSQLPALEKPKINVRIPPPYPEPAVQANGKIRRDELERVFIEGGQAYDACMIELYSAVKQAEACANDPR